MCACRWIALRCTEHLSLDCGSSPDPLEIIYESCSGLPGEGWFLFCQMGWRSALERRYLLGLPP